MLNEYIASLSKKLKPRTVIFLVKENSILLGYKKSGFGKGNYVGIGGKVESAETTEDGAIRELKEEINVDVSFNDLKKVAILKFYFPYIKDESWNQEVYAFVVTQWNGTPIETDEIKPVWFEKNNLPLDKMWDDAKYWIPSILNGEEVYEEYLFDEELKVTEHQKLA